MKKYPSVQVDQFRLENLLPTGWQVQEADGSKKNLICDIEAIHACTTGNFNTYTTEELRKALPTWTSPYHKPILTHHNTRDGEPIGRILDARMGYSEQAKQDCVVIRVEISDAESMQKVKDGRYITVSIGSRTSKAICSICGQDIIAEGYCDHEAGEVYNGKQCTVLLKGITHNEASFVNVPADNNAQVVGIVSEGYLFGSDSLVSLSDPGTNLLEHQGGMQIMEALGIKEVEQLHVLQEAHDTLHTQFTAGPSDALRDAHAEIVRQMLGATIEHAMTDALDETLPEDLRPVIENAPLDFGKFAELLAQSGRDLEAVNVSLAAVTLERDAAKTEAEKLTLENETLQATVTQLGEQLVTVETEVRQVLAEQLVELALPAPEDHAVAVGEFVVKSKDVLRELLTESRKQFKELYVVKDPTLSNEDLPDTSEATATAMRVEAFSGLFRGPSRAITKEVK